MKCATTTSPFEHLEPRQLLSLAYYDFTSIADLPGFTGGEPGALAGASDDGEYLWSVGAEQGATDDSPAFLVIDGRYRPWGDFAGLDGALVIDINSDGQALAMDQTDDRLFLLDLGAGGERRYLDTLITDAPPEFHLPEITAMELGDDGIVVMADNTERYGEAGSVWGLIDREVRELWSSETNTVQIDVEPGNVVYGVQTTYYDHSGYGHNEFSVVCWTQTEGLTAVDGLAWINDATSEGVILGPAADGSGAVVRAADGTLTPIPVVSPMSLGPDGFVLYAIYDDYYNSSASAGVYDGIAAVSLEDRGGGDGAPIVITADGTIVLSTGISHRLSPSELVTAAGDEAIVVVDGFGRTIVSYVSQSGALASISIVNGQIDFGRASGSIYSTQDAEITTLVVPRSSLAYRWAVSGGAAWREVYASDQTRFVKDWNSYPHRDLAVRPVGFASRQGNGVLATQLDDGHFWIFYETPLTWGGQEHWVWYSNDLTQNHLSKRGLETPAFTGGLDAFTTSWGAMNVVGLDAAGQLHAVWWSPGLRSPMWTTTNLSRLAGAPKLVGNVSAAATPWGGMQIHATDERGHLISVWWSPATNRWQTTDLTAQLGGPTLEAGTLGLEIGRWGSINLVAKDAEGEIVSYWWSRATGWEAKTVIEEGEQPRFVGSPSYYVAAQGAQHIAGVDADGHVLDLYWRPDKTGWHWRDLTALAEL